MGVAGGIEKRIEKGEKELEKEELKAERNIPTFKKEDATERVTRKLR